MLSFVTPPLVMVLVAPVSVLIVVLIVSVGGVVSDRRRHRRRGRGVARIVSGLGGEAVAAVKKRSRRVTPVARADRRRTQQGRAVIDLHRADPTGIAHRA